MKTFSVKRVSIICACAILIAAAACSGNRGYAGTQEIASEAPDWVRDRIRSPEGVVPVAVWRVRLAGNEAYYFYSECCDGYNVLFDAHGEEICSPSGGATGGGDGHCPVPLPSPEDPVLIWALEKSFETGTGPDWKKQ